MAVLIDTGVLIALERAAHADDVEAILGGGDRGISVITVSELLHGVSRATGARRATRQAFVEHLLAHLDAIPIDQRVARLHAGLWSHLASIGQLVGAHDMWIGATALAHGLSVATTNRRDFDRIPGLHVIGVSAD